MGYRPGIELKKIEKINILHASLLAMKKRLFLKLKTKPSLVLIDGNKTA